MCRTWTKQHMRQTNGCSNDAEKVIRVMQLLLYVTAARDLVKECQEADIIIAALGQPNFVTADMVKEGCDY